jgi:hypothetical protein
MKCPVKGRQRTRLGAASIDSLEPAVLIYGALGADCLALRQARLTSCGAIGVPCSIAEIGRSARFR